jgi:hypothetical protein
MRRLLIVTLLALSTTSAGAERPSTLAMSCRQAQNLVAHSGAIVLSTGRFTYDRFVANGSFCATGEWAYEASAPTRDAARCTLGYTCKDVPPFWYHNDGGGFFHR